MALKGVKVVEMVGLAPGPFCGMVLADFGATVTVVQKIQESPLEVLSEGKRGIAVNLKTDKGVEVVKRICDHSDVLIDTYRPGVMEKIGLGPDVLMKSNPRLIYARLTGYGQTGPYSGRAGHDINYVALSGVLSMLQKDNKPPQPPVNLLADFAGGGLLCAFGIALALYERTKTNRGQIIDASMLEGTTYLASWLFRSRHLPVWLGEPGTNVLDGGAPFYATYKTKDNKFMAVGALEPQFYKKLIEGLQLDPERYSQLSDWSALRTEYTRIFLTRTQDEWCEIFENTDACVVPVLDMTNLESNKHISFRKSIDKGVPRPAPRFENCSSEEQPHKRGKPMRHGKHTRQILEEIGFESSYIRRLHNDGHIYCAPSSSL